MLCSNAGVGANSGPKAIWEVGKKDWDWVMGVNYQGVLHGFQTFIPHMVEHGEESHLMTTVSLAGLLPGSGTYGVSKHAVMALTEAARNDLLARGANVSVSALCPGFVDTNIDKSERNRPGYLTHQDVSLDESGISPVSQLLRRGKQPSEIADIVFEAIKKGIFYILPHPAWDEMLHDRLEQMLSREPLPTPSQDTIARIFMPRDDGESY